MSDTLSIKINIEKVGFKKIKAADGKDYMILPAERFYQGQKGTYLDLVAFLNDQANEYGEHGAVALQRSKEEKDQPLTYVGNMRRFNSQPSAKPTDDFELPVKLNDNIPF